MANIGEPWATNNTEAEVVTPLQEPEGSLGACPSAAVGRCRRRPGAMGREGDHERPIGLGAEGKAKATAAADALDLAAASPPAAGGAGHEAHPLVAEHRRRIGRHHADRREALERQGCCDGAGLGGGIITTSPLAAACRTAT